MVTGAISEHHGEFAEFGEGSAPTGRRVLTHHVLIAHGEEGFEVLRIPLHGGGEAFPVFSAGWAARGYLFAEAPGAGWYVKTYTPDEMIALLDGAGTNVEWVAFDPIPDHRGSETTNVMPRESFMHYLSSSRATSPLASPKFRERLG